MDRVDLWHARQAMKTLRFDQRVAIAAAADIVIYASHCVTLTPKDDIWCQHLRCFLANLPNAPASILMSGSVCRVVRRRIAQR